jgi:DNA-3-methyladenine glycosylase
MLNPDFFNRDTQTVAIDLLGKVIHSYVDDIWLSAQIIETEAYYINEKGSHASLGITEKRKALFMPPGTIYMYYARGSDSLNVSCAGLGNAVLIKSGYPFPVESLDSEEIRLMQKLNPMKSKRKPRPVENLCSGQTLLCKSLGIKVVDWDQKNFNKEKFYITSTEYIPAKIVQTKRLGIPIGRDEDRLYRFLDIDYAQFATSNPLRKRSWEVGSDYLIREL